MLTRRHLAVALVLPFVAPLVARGDDVQYLEENGVTYRVTKQTVQRPMSETHYEDRPQTYYAEQYQTQYLPSQRTTTVPVWEWVNEPYWVNRYNPFAQPYLAYRTVPRVHWETHTDPVQIPVVQRQVVPQTTTVKVPVTTQRFVAEEQTSKVAVAIKPGTPLGSAPAPLASSGGVQLNSDPPRNPTGTAWKPADQK
jgi:hypothetical protein